MASKIEKATNDIWKETKEHAHSSELVSYLSFYHAPKTSQTHTNIYICHEIYGNHVVNRLATKLYTFKIHENP